MNKRSRIGIDLAAAAGQKSGLGFYTEQIFAALKEVGGDKYEFMPLKTIKKNLRTPERILWNHFGLPVHALFRNVDLLFVPAFSCPRFFKPLVTVAHDIIGFLHPEFFLSPSARYYWSRLLPHSLKRADHIIAISEHTKKDLIKHLNLPSERITVVYPSAAEEFQILSGSSQISPHLDALNIKPPFILTVGTREPRKNYARLVEAFAYSQRKIADKTTQLIIVGKRGWGEDELIHKIRKYQLMDAVQILDYVSSEQLLALYNSCLFFILPSLYEGFGFPALEAMRCGAPVAVSQNTSLPEVVGEAGVMFNPYDVKDIRERLNLLIGDSARRREMQEKSLRQSQKFSWQNSAQKILKIFDRILNYGT